MSPMRNFREIPALPNKEEVGILDQPHLRENIVTGQYANVEQYLDIQFRLMREDMFRYLRESIAEYKGKWFMKKNVLKLENGNAYRNTELKSSGYSNFLYFLISVNVDRNVDWEKSDFLKPMSLLCLSKDNFQSFIFVCVRSRSPISRKSSRCVIKITLENANDSNYFEFHRPYDIIETSSFYESYKYVLNKLQFYNNQNFPLSSCLINFLNCEKLPAYWLKASSLLEMFANLEFNDPYSYGFNRMLKEIPECFDDHQKKAVKMALSCTLSLIQGPPGTGKTFLGLQIMKLLVENASSEMKAPIMVICYTNHALDQFLEGVIKFTGKVLRIGGQSKSNILTPYNLNNVSRAIFLKNKIRSGIISLDELKSIEILNSLGNIKYHNPYFKEVKKLEKSTSKINELIQNIDTDTLYCSSAVLEVFPEDCWREVLGDAAMQLQKKRNFMKDFIRCIETWLGLSKPYALVCQQPLILLNAILKELHNYMQANSTTSNQLHEDRKKSRTKNCGANMFFMKILNAFLNQKRFNIEHKNQTMNFYVTAAISKKIRDFLKGNVLNKSLTFCLLKTAIVQYLNYCNAWNSLDDQKASNMWKLDFVGRWKLFLVWVSRSKEKLKNRLENIAQMCNEKIELRDKIRFLYHKTLLQNADVVGLTTTGAAKNWALMEEVGPRVVFAEEAAEVLEAHIATALTQSTQHLILIGDHKQLRPSPSVYSLGKNYKLDISMFERLLQNGVPSCCLQTQHRMRPCFAQLLVPDIYANLNNHASVLEYEDIKGVSKNMYFVSHDIFEDENDNPYIHSNKHEALFIASMCKYLTQQGYTSKNITVLCLYSGQVTLLIDLMAAKSLDQINVTTVDNFQGEESDIILLSFVRSNKKNRLGFIKIANRICVALSRARKGLYCFGNFNLFGSHCKLWSRIINKIKQMNAISAFLPLKCQNHPQNITLVASEEDFKRVISGGCDTKCDFIFPCQHACRSLCHPMKKHEDMSCPKRCETEKNKPYILDREESNSDFLPLHVCVESPSLVTLNKNFLSTHAKNATKAERTSCKIL